ncbi:FmdB family zinc ribbon protein [Nitrospira sp. Kam-Ns4a]
MPIYEYLCDNCQSRFEIKQKVSDPPLSTCERCGGPVKKLISSPAIMFKGSGWYITDYSDKLKLPAQEAASAPSGNGKKDTAAGQPAGAPSSTGSSGGSSGAGASSQPTSAATAPSSSASSSA